MFHVNHFYGHAHILAGYCGLDEARPPRIKGHLQHGWNTLCGASPENRFLPGATLFVWSPGPSRRGRTLGRRTHCVIGAPWNYLLAGEPEPEDDAEREGTLWFLFHGWERGEISGDHRRLIAQIKETEPGPVTLSLYHTEYRRPEIRKLYEDAGFRVITFGERGWNYRGTDRHFLHKQLAEFRRHRRVASNRLSTAIFYGISAGCRPAVYGDPMVVSDEHPAFGGVPRVKRLWPELFGEDIDLDTAREITREELGTRYLASPEELRELLDWVDHD